MPTGFRRVRGAVFLVEPLFHVLRASLQALYTPRFPRLAAGQREIRAGLGDNRRIPPGRVREIPWRAMVAAGGEKAAEGRRR